jgi:hypothetical protein
MMRAAILSFALVVGLSAPQKMAAAAADPEASNGGRLRIIDEASVEPAVLDEALGQAIRIYRGLSIEFVWMHADDRVHESEFIIKIVRKSLGGSTAVDRALGITPMPGDQGGHHAWLFYDRIEDRAKVLRMSCGALLGVVLAHEIGHLLLPKGSNSDAGLMSRTWDREHVQRAMWGVLTFSPQEEALIRSRLHNSALPAAD